MKLTKNIGDTVMGILSLSRYSLNILLGIAILVVFVIGIVVGKYKLFPYYALVSIQKNLAMVKLGQDGYVEEQLLAQSAPQSGHGNISIQTIETSELPLKLARVPLANRENFPAGGGNVTNIEGAIVILDRLGGLYRYTENGLIKLNFGDFPNNIREFIIRSKNKLSVDSLRTHSIAYDKVDKRIYVSFEKYTKNHTMLFTIASIGIDPKTIEPVGDWQTLFEASEMDESTLGIAGGGKLFISGDKLYFGVGDFSIYAIDGSSEHAAQDVNSPFGKVYECDLRTRKIKVKSIGHRNTQGLALSQEGKLINVEHGPQGGDEMNIIEDGANYGWPVATYGTDYGAYDWSLETQYNKQFFSKGSSAKAKFAEPLFSFVPSVGISSIHLVSGFNERWDGDLLVGSLKAQSLYRMKLKNNRIVFSEPIWIGSRIRDINSFQGKLVLLTDDSQLILIEVDGQKLSTNSKFAGYNFEPKLNACLQCHHFGQTTPANAAPTLVGIFNRKIASDSFSHYSPSLSKIDGTWDKANLKKFIENPSGFAEGSTMPRLGLSEQDIDDIVDILAN